MATSLHEVLTWVEAEGPVLAGCRLRLQILPELLGEGIEPQDIDPATTCTAELLQRVKDAAAAVVGKACP